LGRTPFPATVREQEGLRAAVLAGVGAETLLLCEHEPVITLGRSTREGHVLAAAGDLARRGIAIEVASRGGSATYHGPGQLVGYPIVRLRGGVVDHVTALARAVAAVLAELGVVAVWRREAPGLWVGDEKICAFGVHVRRRVAMHGFALNVTADLDPFNLIVPCGLSGVRTTSIARSLASCPQRVPQLHVLASRVARAVGAELGIAFVPHLDRPRIDQVDLTKVEMSNRIIRMIEA
jgi:lipoyl(octanoyl) transferase